ncbi:MAG TPA: MFS transporter [Stellaceae bacterium]|nr:MFS transporter [Stellaceae bacterium]
MTIISPRAAGARLGAFYAASFLVVGIQSPFWPVWLAGRGLGAREIAALFAATIWVKVATTPLIGALADRLGRRRAMMTVLAGIAWLGYASLWQAHGFGTLLGLTVIAGAAQSAVMPLGDSITLAAVRRDGLDYGRVRVWGSVSFILAAMASGALLSNRAGLNLGGDTVLVLVLAASALLWIACLAVPPPPREAMGPPRLSALGAMARDRRFWGFVAAAAAIQASHQVYYGFGTLYWRSLGFSDATIGCLWAEGVVAEIVLFWQGGRLLARLGPLGLMATGAAAGILRWGLAGLIPGLLPAAVLQLLHALTFGATHLGAMNFLSRTVPPGASASAQALYSGSSAGIGSGIVMLGAGALYASYGGHAYLFMAALSALGLACVARLAKAKAAPR